MNAFLLLLTLSPKVSSKFFFKIASLFFPTCMNSNADDKQYKWNIRKAPVYLWAICAASMVYFLLYRVPWAVIHVLDTQFQRDCILSLFSQIVLQKHEGQCTWVKLHLLQKAEFCTWVLMVMTFTSKNNIYLVWLDHISFGHLFAVQHGRKIFARKKILNVCQKHDYKLCLCPLNIPLGIQSMSNFSSDQGHLPSCFSCIF